MDVTILQISIPNNKIIPSIITTFTPEENYAMIHIGSNAIAEARQSVISFTNEKITEEYKFKINELENKINVEKQLSSMLNEKMMLMYEGKIDKLNERVQQLSHEILEKNKDSGEISNEEIEKIKNKYEILLEEKEKENILSRETFDRLLIQLNGSTTLTAKGKKGESTFYDIANTFKDFNEFKIQDKHNDAGLGDFHLHFENFDVLVDAKNYKDNVNKKQRDKIKNDLLGNEHITFAWLVSLNSGIATHDRLPIMHEFINTKQCVIYINNLLSYENPEQILRIAWSFCCQIHKIISLTNIDNNDITEITELKNKHYKMYDKIKNMKIIIKEINSSINTLKNQIELINVDVIQILELETGEILESNNAVYDDWWDEHMERTEENVTITSTEIWTRFKKNNKNILTNFEVNCDNFKKYIISKLNVDDYTMKTKGGTITINNYKLKTSNMNFNTISNIQQKIELIENSNEKDEIPDKKITKKKSTMKSGLYYIDEEVDKKIITDYTTTDDDITNIAMNNNLEIYKIISILVKHKIINDRTKARGYEIYKESDTYKLKMMNSIK